MRKECGGGGHPSPSSLCININWILTTVAVSIILRSIEQTGSRNTCLGDIILGTRARRSVMQTANPIGLSCGRSLVPYSQDDLMDDCGDDQKWGYQKKSKWLLLEDQKRQITVHRPRKYSLWIGLTFFCFSLYLSHTLSLYLSLCYFQIKTQQISDHNSK